MGKVYDWFEERLEVQAIADDISSKYGKAQKGCQKDCNALNCLLM